MYKKDIWKVIKKRQNYFAEFQEQGKCMFQKHHRRYLKLRHKETQKFDEAYFLEITPKGRWSGHDDSIFQIFYGNRISGHEEGINVTKDGAKNRYFKNYTESGVEMTFEFKQQGLVDVYIRAAKDETQAESSREDGILIGRRIKPRRLLKNRIVKKYWKILFSYMEYTSSLGEPSIFDKIRYYWYINHKGYVCKDGKIQKRKLAENWLKILIYLITTFIGLISAIAVAGIVYWLGFY